MCFETSSMTYWCRGRRSAESRVGAILLQREHKVEPSAPAQLEPAAYHSEVLERLELGVGAATGGA
jgi:hypothetical protein